MIEVVCPECGVEGLFRQDDLSLYSQIRCEACGSTLEVVEESPLQLEIAEDDLPSDDDEYDEDDDDI